MPHSGVTSQSTDVEHTGSTILTVLTVYTQHSLQYVTTDYNLNINNSQKTCSSSHDMQLYGCMYKLGIRPHPQFTVLWG